MANYITYGSSFTSFTCSVEGLAFIAAHEAATGLTMGDVQKTAICGFIDRLKGNNTTNGSDIWTKAVSSNALIYPLCPIDDSTANANAYNIELISQAALGNFINFVPADITPNGVQGGTGKYFNTTVNHSLYPQNNNSIGGYINIGNTGSEQIAGVTPPNFYLQASTVSFIWRLNSSGGGTYIDAVRDGMFIAQRNNSNNTNLYKNGVLVSSISLASSTPASKSVFFHRVSGLNTYFSGRFTMYIYGMPSMTPNEQADFYEAVQWYQTNVITGGRNV